MRHRGSPCARRTYPDIRILTPSSIQLSISVTADCAPGCRQVEKVSAGWKRPDPLRSHQPAGGGDILIHTCPSAWRPISKTVRSPLGSGGGSEMIEIDTGAGQDRRLLRPDDPDCTEHIAIVGILEEDALQSSECPSIQKQRTCVASVLRMKIVPRPVTLGRKGGSGEPAGDRAIDIIRS